MPTNRLATPLPVISFPLLRRCVLLLSLGVGAAAVATEADNKRLAIERLFRGGQATQVAQAMQLIERAVSDQPEDAAMRFLHGVMLSESRREGEAMRTFERLTEDFPGLPEPYNNLAVLHASQGRLDKSRELLETALRNDPGYRTAQQNLGDIFVRLAVRAYESAAGTERGDEALLRKLRLARDLAGSNARP